MRGDRYRDALAYVDSLDLVLGLGAERLLTGHFDPIEGADRIAEEVTAMRDATQWVHDRTVDGMNAGTDVHTLMREVRVPDHLDVGEGYGRTSWNVRAIWETYAGWFHHRSTTELYDVPTSTDRPRPRGPGRCRCPGRAPPGTGSRAGEPVAALHLTDIVLAADPDHAPARERRRGSHPLRCSTTSTNFWERAWLTRSLASTGGSMTNTDQLRLHRCRRAGDRGHQRHRPRHGHELRRRRGHGHGDRHPCLSRRLRHRPRAVHLPPAAR